MQMVIFREFPLIGAVFGLVSHNGLLREEDIYGPKDWDRTRLQ